MEPLPKIKEGGLLSPLSPRRAKIQRLSIILHCDSGEVWMLECVSKLTIYKPCLLTLILNHRVSFYQELGQPSTCSNFQTSKVSKISGLDAFWCLHHCSLETSMWRQYLNNSINFTTRTFDFVSSSHNEL